ncbi:hypothetical protein V1J52_22910 [Streptomyces sp. TRM 70351]|uniref:hypothetical protein n=1 Tax=Streptomyces sp. TRM 70351 TaxID=3116552 RepID=UPI002E7B0D46|nr:hypothetical protein [Streptomyces sp. TRM 70351]MEE1930993.1 hypothetical protein [Streptomyces sp. TRM 70351]
MTPYRISYAPPADDALRKMNRRAAFEAAIGGTVGRDPYGHGSVHVGGDRDRREATVAGAVVRYVVSGSIRTVTVVRLISL